MLVSSSPAVINLKAILSVNAVHRNHDHIPSHVRKRTGAVNGAVVIKCVNESGVAVELERFLVGQAAGAERAVAEFVAAERVNVVAPRKILRAVNAEGGDVEHE